MNKHISSETLQDFFKTLEEVEAVDSMAQQKMEFAVQKGSRIRAEWFDTDLFTASLAGVQLKTTGRPKSITGTIRHMRTNDPNWAPENVVLFVELDEDDGTGTHCDKCGVMEVQIKPSWIREVIAL